MGSARGLVGAVLGAEVAVAEVFADIDGVELFADERQRIAGSVESRRREFATGRECARRALELLGHPRASIGTGPRNTPVWPAGVVGSITHCAGYRAAAVAASGSIVALGIDAEPHGELPPELLPSVLTGTERAELGALTRDRPDTRWPRLLFSAKEAVYKAWFPLTGRWLGFEDVHVRLDPASSTFVATLLVAPAHIGGRPLPSLSGRWVLGNDLVVTAVTVAAAAPSTEIDESLDPIGQ